MVASSPDGPSDDEGGLDPALSETVREPPDLLDGPSHHGRRRSAAALFGGDAAAFARWRITASRAKASKFVLDFIIEIII